MTAEAYARAAAHAMPGGIVKFTYAVPDFANPTGVTLSLEERQGLLALAFNLGIPAIEDAAYTARCSEGEAIPLVMALEVASVRHVDTPRVIYCGTFSKTLNLRLRPGWICAARPAISRLILAKQASDLNNPLMSQMMMHQKEQWLRLSVINSGVGVQIADLDRVFKPFQRVSSSFSRDHQRAGLGLSITRSLVQIHGGSLHLETLPGKGATAVLHLPIAEPKDVG